MVFFGSKVLKVEKDILNTENAILSKKVLSFKREIDSENENFILFFNYLDEKIPTKEAYADINALKKAVGLTYRFNGESLELDSEDCIVSFGGRDPSTVWLDIGLDFDNKIGTLKDLTASEALYFKSLFKSSFTLKITVDKGIYKVFDRLHDKVVIKDDLVVLKFDFIPK